MSLTRVCDMRCGRAVEVRRYTLARKVRHEDGTKHSLPCGGLDICLQEWESICKPRMKAESPDWYLAGAQVCDKCGSRESITRYSVKRSVRTGHVVTDIAGGGISLCHQCWSVTAKPRMRAVRVP